MRPKPYTSTRVLAGTRGYIFRIAGKMRFCSLVRGLPLKCTREYPRVPAKIQDRQRASDDRRG
jgi:hypothetical protein